ncbi:MAG: HAD-IC family P-type ATPase [Gemmataceae bacterium]
MNGLSSEEVESRRKQFGSNVLAHPPRDPWWKQYLSKFDDPVIRILLIAAVLSIIVGMVDNHYAEGIGIVAAVILATGLAYWNEARAGRQFDLLHSSTDELPVTVKRNGEFVRIPRRDLVVGDVVQIETGEEVPADGNLVSASSLLVDESRLTGESIPVSKSPDHSVNEADAYPAHRLLRGTNAIEGIGVMVVSAVGEKTEIGTTAQAAAEDSGIETPLSKQLAKLSRIIGVVGFAVAVVTFFLLLTRDVSIGRIAFTSSEAIVACLAGLSVMVALVRVWLPIVCDGVEMIRPNWNRPQWLEREGFATWLVPLFGGLGIFLVGIGLGIAAHFLPRSPSEWINHDIIADLLQCFMIAVTIIVVAVPEGLAMSVTLSLAYSMRRMAAQQTLVRQLHACETIGAATVICSDKTGTLTQNSMRVVSTSFQSSNLLPLVAEAMAANTSAHLNRTTTPPTVLGNPTDGAILLWLHESGVDYSSIRAEFNPEVVWPFSTERKMSGLGAVARPRRNGGVRQRGTGNGAEPLPALPDQVNVAYELNHERNHETNHGMPEAWHARDWDCVSNGGGGSRFLRSRIRSDLVGLRGHCRPRAERCAPGHRGLPAGWCRNQNCDGR